MHAVQSGQGVGPPMNELDRSCSGGLGMDGVLGCSSSKLVFG